MDHSPLPWSFDHIKKEKQIRIRDANGLTVAFTEFLDSKSVATYYHIIKSVNSRNVLIEECEIVEAYLDVLCETDWSLGHYQMAEVLRAALAKAERKD